jgi:hypothetical protein
MATVDLKAASLAGLSAGVAYAATAEIDNRISGHNLDDLKLLGRLLVDDPSKAKAAGIPVHLFNAVSLAALFPLVRRFLPGGKVLQGITFATVENTLLYPIAALEEKHPGIRNGEIDRYFSIQSVSLVDSPPHRIRRDARFPVRPTSSPIARAWPIDSRPCRVRISRSWSATTS